jgi:hypothetical protein
VIEPIHDLPPDVIGFRASGKVTRDEYHQMMKPLYTPLEKAAR